MKPLTPVSPPGGLESPKQLNEQPIQSRTEGGGGAGESGQQTNEQRSKEGMQSQSSPDTKSSGHPETEIVRMSHHSEEPADHKEFLSRLLRGAHSGGQAPWDDQNVPNEVDDSSDQHFPESQELPPDEENEGYYEGDDVDEKSLTCDDLPCGDGQLTCKGPFRGYFVCTCMPGYLLQRGSQWQPVCTKNDTAEIIGKPDQTQQGESKNTDKKWIIAWSIMGSTLGIIVIAATAWGLAVMYRRRKSTASRSVQEEFSSLLKDDRSSTASGCSRQEKDVANKVAG